MDIDPRNDCWPLQRQPLRDKLQAGYVLALAPAEGVPRAVLRPRAAPQPQQASPRSGAATRPGIPS